MRRFGLFLLCWFLGLPLLSASPLPAVSPDSLFARHDYVEASNAYEQLLQQEGPTVARLFNLGNSYYQQGQLGRAMLAYERAQLLDPRDATLRDVRSFLSRKTVDKLPSPEGWLRPIGDRIAYALPLVGWLVLTPLFFALSLIGWVLFALSREPRSRKLTFYSALGSLLLFLGAGLMLLHWTSGPMLAEGRGVILLPEVEAYAQPSTASSKLTKLHEGARIELLAPPKDGLCRIRLADGRTAWIASHAIEAIAPLPYSPQAPVR